MFKRKKIVNIVECNGIISSKGKRSLSLSNIKPLLDKAFDKPKNTQAVVLLINSPGGSASQSEIIAKYIKSKSTTNKIPVIAVVEDVAASGGYFIASIANEIYALANTSIVGSIGVLYGGFGFNNFINKHGIERRLYTAGENKAILDSFSPETPRDTAIIKELLEQTHKHFIDFVVVGRGSKLVNTDPDIFSGKFWLASEGIKLGLIDGIIDSTESFLKQKFGKKVKINTLKAKKKFLSGLLSTSVTVDEEIVSTVVNELKSQLLATQLISN